MSERDDAIKLANRVLDKPSIDPDGDICVLARQFLIALEKHTVIDGTAPSLGDCIYIIRVETERLREEMRAKGYTDSNVAIEVHVAGYNFVKLDTHKERIFQGYSFNWIAKRNFNVARADAEAAIKAMPTNYPSEACAPWFTVEPAAQEEPAQ